MPHSVISVPVVQVAHCYVSPIHWRVVKRFENGSHNDSRANDTNETKNGDIITVEIEGVGCHS